MKSIIKRKLLKFDAPRRVVQLLSFIFLSAIVFGLGTLPILLPVLWTWGLNPNTAGDAFTAIQFMLYNVLFPWAAVASFLIVGILLGKSFCGWICPFGFAQDLIGLLKRKKKKISPRTHESLIYGKYIILCATLLVGVTFSAARIAGASRGYEGALGIFALAPFSTLSPAETLFGTLPRMIQDLHNATTQIPFSEILPGALSLPPIFWAQIFIMGSVLVFSAYVPRGWCKYLCPHGGIMAIMNRFSFLGLRRDPVRCARGECRLCVQVCPMNIRILDLPWEKFSDPECIYCLKCIDACPDGAINLKYP